MVTIFKYISTYGFHFWCQAGLLEKYLKIMHVHFCIHMIEEKSIEVDVLVIQTNF